MTNTNTTNNKITYVSAINLAIRALNGEKIENRIEVADKLLALGTQLEKRNATKSGKPTKKQTENAEVKQAILDTLLVGEGKRCGEIAAEVGISGQKCSALLSQMYKAKEIARKTDKRVAYFAHVGAEGFYLYNPEAEKGE